jgi:undecaprenyl-diphosphatase
MSSVINFLRRSSIVRCFVGFALAALVLWLSGWFVTGPYKQYPGSFDATVRYTMRQIQSPMWTQLFLTVTRLGSTIALIIIGCTAGIIFIALRWFRPVLLLIIVMSGQALLHHGFKLLFARPRPASLINYPAVESFSFPSGHAVSSLCLYGTLAWIVASSLENTAAKAGIGIFAAVLIFLIGMSRVYIGVHYPTDVIAGFAAAAIWTAAVLSIDRKAL